MSAHLLIYSFLFFKLLLAFGLDFELGLGLMLGLEFGLGLGIGGHKSVNNEANFFINLLIR